jgi:hypothetical protein
MPDEDEPAAGFGAGLAAGLGALAAAAVARTWAAFDGAPPGIRSGCWQLGHLTALPAS